MLPPAEGTPISPPEPATSIEVSISHHYKILSGHLSAIADLSIFPEAAAGEIKKTTDDRTTSPIEQAGIISEQQTEYLIDLYDNLSQEANSMVNRIPEGKAFDPCYYNEITAAIEAMHQIFAASRNIDLRAIYNKNQASLVRQKIWVLNQNQYTVLEQPPSYYAKILSRSLAALADSSIYPDKVRNAITVEVLEAVNALAPKDRLYDLYDRLSEEANRIVNQKSQAAKEFDPCYYSQLTNSLHALGLILDIDINTLTKQRTWVLEQELAFSKELARKLDTKEAVAGYAVELELKGNKNWLVDPNRLMTFINQNCPGIEKRPVFIGVETDMETGKKKGLIFSTKEQFFKYAQTHGISDEHGWEELKGQAEVWDQNFLTAVHIASSFWKDAERFARDNKEEGGCQPFLGLPRAYLQYLGKGERDVIEDAFKEFRYMTDLEARRAEGILRKAEGVWSRATFPLIRSTFREALRRMKGLSGGYSPEAFFLERLRKYIFEPYWYDRRINKKLESGELGLRVLQGLTTQTDDISESQTEFRRAIEELEEEGLISGKLTYQNRLQKKRLEEYLLACNRAQRQDRDITYRKTMLGGRELCSFSDAGKTKIRIFAHGKFAVVDLEDFGKYSKDHGFTWNQDGMQDFQNMINNIFYNDKWNGYTACGILQTDGKKRRRTTDTALKQEVLGSIILHESREELFADYASVGGLAGDGKQAFTLAFQVDKKNNRWEHYRTIYGHASKDGLQAKELDEIDLAKFHSEQHGFQSGWSEPKIDDSDIDVVFAFGRNGRILHLEECVYRQKHEDSRKSAEMENRLLAKIKQELPGVYELQKAKVIKHALGEEMPPGIEDPLELYFDDVNKKVKEKLEGAHAGKERDADKNLSVASADLLLRPYVYPSFLRSYAISRFVDGTLNICVAPDKRRSILAGSGRFTVTSFASMSLNRLGDLYTLLCADTTEKRNAAIGALSIQTVLATVTGRRLEDSMSRLSSAISPAAVRAGARAKTQLSSVGDIPDGADFITSDYAELDGPTIGEVEGKSTIYRTFRDSSSDFFRRLNEKIRQKRLARDRITTSTLIEIAREVANQRREEFSKIQLRSYYELTRLLELS